MLMLDVLFASWFVCLCYNSQVGYYAEQFGIGFLT